MPSIENWFIWSTLKVKESTGMISQLMSLPCWGAKQWSVSLIISCLIPWKCWHTRGQHNGQPRPFSHIFIWLGAMDKKSNLNIILWDAIIHPCPDYNSTLDKPLKSWWYWMSNYTLIYVDVLIYCGLKITPVQHSSWSLFSKEVLEWLLH